MEKSAEKALYGVLSDSAPLSRTLRAQRSFEALDRQVRPALSVAAREQVSVACVEGDTLVLAARSSVWASRARLESSAALQAAGAVWPQALTRVRVIVVPPLPGSADD